MFIKPLVLAVCAFLPTYALAQTTFNCTGSGPQTFTVPTAGTYRIEADAASGGNNPGLGAKISSIFHLSAGQVLSIYVGCHGTNGGNFAGGGGGGGTFVVDAANVPLIIAGGGGGGGSPQSSNVGVNGSINPGPTGGGGSGNNDPGGAAGGGGFTGDGGNGNGPICPTSQGGKGFPVLTGGPSAVGCGTYGIGGYGGGGAGGGNSGGGGGGAKGGNGGSGANQGGGGGGGSFLAASAIGLTTGTNSGDGKVVITATQLSISATAGSGQATNINTSFPAALKATVVETGNVAVPGASVTFTAPPLGPSGTFGGSCSGATCVVTTDASGVATAPVFTANGTNGSYTVIASIDSGAIFTSPGFALTNLVPPVPPTISKSFTPTAIIVGANSILSFTISNPNTVAGSNVTLTGINTSDTLPSGVVVATPNGLTGSCGGGTITATAGSGTITLTGATLTPSASCTFSVNVTATSVGTKNNSVSVTSNEAGAGANGTATLTVAMPPTISKAFADSQLQLMGASNTTALTFTVGNPAGNITLSTIAFSDTLPSGLLVATPNNLTGTCGGGTVTAVAGTNLITLSGATLPAGTTCTFSVDVSGVAVGVQTNTTGPVTALNGAIVGPTATASTAVDYLLFYWFFAAGSGGVSQ